MKLTFVTHSFPPADRPLASVGGMQRVAVELDAALRQRTDIEYETMALRSSWRWINLRTPLFLAGALVRLRRRIVREQTDVILFSSMVTASLAVPLRGALTRHGVRAAAIVHGQDVTLPNAAYQRWVRQVFAALDLVMPVSGATGEQCTRRGLPPERLRVVHNGVDVARFDESVTDGTRERAREMRSAYLQETDDTPEPSPPLVLLSVGRQVERKGFAWFVENVMPHLPDHIHYWLAGDGPEADAVESGILDHALGGRVRRLGRVSEEDLLALYEAADLFVMPNIPVPGDMEGFGIVMLEAGMMGVPTVASRLEGIREVVTEGRNGYFVESGDAPGFIRRITELDRDRVELAALSERTRRHVRHTFSWQTVASNYINVLRESKQR